MCCLFGGDEEEWVGEIKIHSGGWNKYYLIFTLFPEQESIKTSIHVSGALKIIVPCVCPSACGQCQGEP